MMTTVLFLCRLLGRIVPVLNMLKPARQSSLFCEPRFKIYSCGLVATE